MDTSAGAVELPVAVTKAVAKVEGAMTTLVGLLASPDGATRAGALAVLDGLGVVSIGYLALGLATGTDAAYRVRIVEALGALAPVSRTTVLLALAAAATDRDPAVRMAATRVVTGLGSVHAAKPPNRARPGA